MITTDLDLIHFAAIVKNVADPQTLLSSGALEIARRGTLSVDWAPFDHTPRTACLVICGITPGRTQALNALSAFQRSLRAGSDIDAALRTAKLEGSFSGTMRANIVRMLNSIGVHQALGVDGCLKLFDPAHELVHLTSALRYPVFVAGENYNGNPNMLRTPMLRETIETCLAAEARLLHDAVWLPLGPKPIMALRHLVSRGLLPADRVLEGMPHPSGANAERIAFFLGQKDRANLSVKTRADPIERARDLLCAQVARLRSA